jgi:hypothetical protein
MQYQRVDFTEDIFRSRKWRKIIRILLKYFGPDAKLTFISTVFYQFLDFASFLFGQQNLIVLARTWNPYLSE